MTGGDAPGDAGAWPEWYATRRLLPYLRRAADAGALGPEHARPVEAVLARITELAGPAEPPSRLHGDCWSGNVLWSGGRGWLIDPAAHGGHRETDLAMLALFGAPFLDRILASYDETAPLAAGCRARVPLRSATSTRRIELDELVAPITRIASTSPAIAFTAAWRFEVA